MSEVNVKERNVSDRGETARGHDSWEVDVYVYLHSDQAGDFTVESYLQSNPNNTKLIFYNRYHPGFFVKFHLIDEHNLGYRFPLPSNREDALLSQLGSTCPTIEDPHWDVFDKRSIQVLDNLTVRAFNPNEDPVLGDFQYTLNVSKDGKPPYLPLDPGGTNNNGMTSQQRID